MSDKLVEVLLPVVLVVISALGTFVVQLIRLQTIKVQKQIQSLSSEEDRVLAKSTLIEAERFIDEAVVATNQLLVDNLKKANEDGKLSPEEIENAFKQTYDTALGLMGDKLKSEVEKLVPNFNTWMQTKIQYYVRQNK